MTIILFFLFLILLAILPSLAGVFMSTSRDRRVASNSFSSWLF